MCKFVNIFYNLHLDYPTLILQDECVHVIQYKPYIDNCLLSVDLLKTVLSLYLHDRDKPLPQAEELLMCSPHTTMEQVII